MHEHIRSFKQNLTQKFCKNLINFENPKIFQKPKNLGLYEWIAWRKIENKIIPDKGRSL